MHRTMHLSSLSVFSEQQRRRNSGATLKLSRYDFCSRIRVFGYPMGTPGYLDKCSALVLNERCSRRYSRQVLRTGRAAFALPFHGAAPIHDMKFHSKSNRMDIH